MVELLADHSRHFDKEYKVERDLLEHPAAQRSFRVAWNARNVPLGEFATELKKSDSDWSIWCHFCVKSRADSLRVAMGKAANHGAFQRAIAATHTLVEILPHDVAPHLSHADF